MSIFNKYSLIEDSAIRTKNKGPLIKDNIHLQANEVNGHYVGELVTFADVKADDLITAIQGNSGDESVSEEKTPATRRVRKELEKVEGIAVWRASEEYKSISEQSFAFLGYY
ncbi:hypothetical protein BGZ47_009385 [Haplosporangium gracile]|nr:hypothetical protein BGZ47_009385 [Haplosporangium gracile]